MGRLGTETAFDVLVRARALEAHGREVIHLEIGEPDFPTPENVKEAAIRAIRENFSKYTATPGTMELRQGIVEWHKRELGTSYVPAEVIATAGGKQAIFNLICSVINHGDEVILPVPYWVTFADVINFCGGKPVMLETSEAQDFDLTAEMIQRAITPRTKLVVINSPCNPSGAVVSVKEFEKILAVTADADAYLLSDECYSHFVYEGTPFSVGSLANAKENVIIVGSLSKTYAMTGWRVGYALAPAPIVAAMTKLQSHSTSNPSSIAQKAAVEALKGQQESVGKMLAEYRRRRDFVIGKLRAIPGVSCTMPRGAFYAYPNVGAYIGGGKLAPTVNDLAKRLLREAGVVVVPGEAFGTAQHFRLSYATSMDLLEKGLQRLHTFFTHQ